MKMNRFIEMLITRDIKSRRLVPCWLIYLINVVFVVVTCWHVDINAFPRRGVDIQVQDSNLMFYDSALVN